MTLLKDYSSLCFIQLLNGQNLIAAKITLSDDELVLDRPRMLLIQSDGRGGGHVVMVKMGAPFIDSGNTISIAKSAILTIIEMSSLTQMNVDTRKLLDEYKRQISPIDTNLNIGNLAGFKA